MLNADAAVDVPSIKRDNLTHILFKYKLFDSYLVKINYRFIITYNVLKYNRPSNNER